MSSTKQNAGSSTAKGKQPARDSDSDSFDEEIVVARPRGQIRPSVLKPPNNSSESDGGVSISDGGVELASDDDSASEIEAKWAAFQESAAKFSQTEENMQNYHRFLADEELTEDAFAKLVDALALSQLDMDEDTEPGAPEATKSSSGPNVKASRPSAKYQPPAQVKTGRASLTKNERKKLSKMKPAIDQFLLAIGYEELRANVPEIKFQWIGDHPHDADERVKWIQRQTKVEAFKTSDKGEALILECNEDKDGKWSPMTRFAQLFLEDAATRDNVLPVFLWVHGIRTYNPREGCALMMAKVLNNGFDPNIVIPDKFGRPIQMLASFLTSHRRRSPIWIVIDSIGLYDDAPPEFAPQWQILCQRLLDTTRSNPPDLKPVKLLFVNPVESKVVNKIKKSHPDVLVLKCPTVDEFREEYPDGKMPPLQ